jgi:signal peptidase I
MSENTDQVQDTKTSTLKDKIFKELKGLPLIILVVFAFRSTFYEPFKIPTGSMIPTLLIGDFILVNKFSYGFKIPFTEWFGDDAIYLTDFKPPKRGDVVVFKYPRDPSFNYIKRVIGVPGDTIEVINKVLFINNEPVSKTAIDGEEIMQDMDEKYRYKEFEFFDAKIGDANFVYQIDVNNSYSRNTPKLTVPEGHLFMMGDNRDNSSDSRFWGFVPFDHVRGQAVLVWFGLSIPHPWAEPGTSFKFRPWRIGEFIE